MPFYQDKKSLMCAFNVREQLPAYYEEFLDSGDVNMIRAMQLYRDNGFKGMLIPDQMQFPSVKQPWIAGAAYTIGRMRAFLAALQIEIGE